MTSNVVSLLQIKRERSRTLLLDVVNFLETCGDISSIKADEWRDKILSKE